MSERSCRNCGWANWSIPEYGEGEGIGVCAAVPLALASYLVGMVARSGMRKDVPLLYILYDDPFVDCQMHKPKPAEEARDA